MSAKKGIKRKSFTPLVFELENCELSPESGEIIEDSAVSPRETSCTVENTEESVENTSSNVLEISDDPEFVVLSETSEDNVQVIESSSSGINESNDDVQIIEEESNIAITKKSGNETEDGIIVNKINENLEVVDVTKAETNMTDSMNNKDNDIKNIDSQLQNDIVISELNNPEIIETIEVMPVQKDNNEVVNSSEISPQLVDELEQEEIVEDNDPIIKISFSNYKVSMKYKSKFQSFLKSFTTLTSFDRDNEIHIFQSAEEQSPRSKRSRKKFKIRKELFIVDSTPFIGDIQKPKYDSKCQVIEAPVTSEEGVEMKNNFGPSCFNCSGSHSLKDCTEPRDLNAIRFNRQKKNNSNKAQKLVRYHEECNDGSYVAGVVSDKLRKALGIRKNAIPEYIYRMRVLGYPPGWLEEAKTTGSNLAIIFDEGKVDNGTIQPDGIDSSKIINYPGFNVKTDKSVRDDYKIFSVPKFSEIHSKEAMIKSFNNLQSQMQDNVEVCDMEIDKEEEQPEPPGCDTIELNDVEINEKTTEINEKTEEVKVKSVEIDEKAVEIDEKSVEIVEKAVEIDEKAVEINEEATEVITKEVKETLVQETGKVSPSLDDLESQKKELLEELVNANTNGDLNETVEAEDAPAPNTPKNQIIKSSMFGTPILKSASPYSRLPNSENFSKDVSPVINFENLPNSTGSYNKMIGVIEKVRKTLKNVQDSG